jgi:hypothetical protein
VTSSALSVNCGFRCWKKRKREREGRKEKERMVEQGGHGREGVREISHSLPVVWRDGKWE